MKNLSGAVLGLIAIIAWACPTEAADFSGLDGKYKSKVAIDLGGQPVSGNASVNVASSKNGQTATLKVTGTVVAMGSTLPMSATLRFSGKRSFTSNTLIFNLVPTGGVKGTFKQKGRKTTFKAPWVFSGQTGNIEGELSVSKDGKKLKLVYILSESSQAFTYRFVFDGKRKGK